MIPLYILGLLMQYGPQHGYQIKRIIGEQLADFTQIKLPSIYYHLEKMAEEGFLSAASERPGSRPEKTVYSVNEKGKEHFHALLTGLLAFEYRPSFAQDGAFYFADYLSEEQLKGSLRTHIDAMGNTLRILDEHRNQAMRFIPQNARAMAQIIFNHHARHYQAELDWANDSLLMLEKEDHDA